MKHVLLLGAGQAHLHLLAQLAGQRLPGTQVTLVTPFERAVQFGRLADFVAGTYPLEACTVDLTRLIEASGVRWLARSAVGLDAQRRLVQLDDGSSLDYQLLSINTGPSHDRQRVEAVMPGAREHALFVRPTEAFVQLWPQVCALAERRSLRMAVIGAGAGGVELACAIADRLPTASLTLLSGQRGLLPQYSPAMQQAARHALQQRHINVIQARASAIESGLVHLSNGSGLRCDVPVLTTGAQAPGWLSDSGLALDAQGFVRVDDCQRSISHPQVLAAGDVCTRQDGSGQRNGVFAQQTALALLASLRALAAGIEPKPYPLRAPKLRHLNCGSRQAIASWGPFTAQGRWVWHIKQRIDQARLKQLLKPGRA